MFYLQKMLYDGDGRKTLKYKNENKEKITVWLPSHPHPVYKMVADCFPVAESTENKPDLP